MINGGSSTVTAPDHLYTWLDVDQYFAMLAENGEWPPWVLEVDAYWDGVRLTVSETVAAETVWSWLRDVLGPLTVAPDREVLLLDDAGEERPLAVEIETAATPPAPERRPRWTDRRVVPSLADPLPPPASERLPHDVAIAAFHSFKGGVGRTLHCVALARELANTGHRVLLVDADLEAPGITWMVAEAMRIDFAFEDFLALVHGSADDQYQDAINLGRKFLANQELDGVVVMPARRDYQRVVPPWIRPDDLLTPGRAPYVLTEVLAELGEAVGAGIVLVDLRAGVSELSSPLLLDPRVHRVVVTTTSDQAVRGTRQLLYQLARRAPATRASDPQCQVLLTQVNLPDHQDVISAVAPDLAAAALRVSGVEDRNGGSAVDLDVAGTVLPSHFSSSLLSLPPAWGEVLDRATRADLNEWVQPLVETLQSARTPLVDPARTDAQPSVVNDQRRELADTAAQLIYAEVSADGGFLATEALRSLVEAHRTEVPIEIVIGGKGSGKTFTHLQLCSSQSWRDFARDAGVSSVSVVAATVPVLASAQLGPERQTQLDDLQRSAASQLTGAAPLGLSGIRDLIRAYLRNDLDELGWRAVWLTCFARAAGLEATPADVEATLTEFARSSHAIFVLDGLEDLFQEFTDDRNQQRALRALLTDCPDWLRALRGRPLGLVVFVRRDLAQTALPNNFPQFERRHDKYALRWNHEEALRLAAWVCHRGGAIGATDEEIKRANHKLLSERLLAIWGDKMGSPKSREARSERWFFAALSDFNQQIQARDIVSFLGEAARESVGDTRWTERVLTPSAMRNALGACSRQKIEAIREENKPVGGLLERLRNLDAEQRKVPFRLADLSLSVDDAALLEANGVLFREGDQYWIPEIYRHGLDFRASGRPRVVNIANLVRRRNDPTT